MGGEHTSDNRLPKSEGSGCGGHWDTPPSQVSLRVSGCRDRGVASVGPPQKPCRGWWGQQGHSVWGNRGVWGGRQCWDPPKLLQGKAGMWKRRLVVPVGELEVQEEGWHHWDLPQTPAGDSRDGGDPKWGTEGLWGVKVESSQFWGVLGRFWWSQRGLGVPWGLRGVPLILGSLGDFRVLGGV